MIEYEGREYDPLAVVHQKVTGAVEVRAMREEAERIERDGQLSLYVPGVAYLSGFREGVQAMDAKRQYDLGLHVTKFMDDEELGRLNYVDNEAPSNILRIDMPSLGVVLGSHVDGMAERQLGFERRYLESAIKFRDNVYAAVSDRRIPWYAANGLENVNFSWAWAIDHPAMQEMANHRTAAQVHMDIRHVLVRDEQSLELESKYMHHEMVHLISARPAKHPEQTQTYPYFGLYYFPVNGQDTEAHRWVNEAMTEHLNMTINGYKTGSYAPERDLLGAVFKRGGKGIERRATNAYFANPESHGVDADQIRLNLYRELTRITRSVGLGSITDIAMRTEEIDDLVVRDKVFEQYTRALDPNYPFDQDAAVINIEEYRSDRARKILAAGKEQPPHA